MSCTAAYVAADGPRSIRSIGTRMRNARISSSTAGSVCCRWAPSANLAEPMRDLDSLNETELEAILNKEREVLVMNSPLTKAEQLKKEVNFVRKMSSLTEILPLKP